MDDNDPNDDSPAQPLRADAPMEPIDTGPNGDIVWHGLRDAWLADRVVSRSPSHLKGGYAWDASRYFPVLMRGEEGSPVLLFARTA